MDGGVVEVDGVESFHCRVEARGVEPQPGEQDLARVHVPFLLVALEAGEYGVLGAARPPARNRNEVIAARGVGVRLCFVGGDGLAAVDTMAFEAGDEGFDLHEAGNPWLRVRAQGYALRSRVNGLFKSLFCEARRARVRMISGMNTAGKVTALRQSSGVEICDIPPPSAGRRLRLIVLFGWQELFRGADVDDLRKALGVVPIKDFGRLPIEGAGDVRLLHADDRGSAGVGKSSAGPKVKSAPPYFLWASGAGAVEAPFACLAFVGCAAQFIGRDVE